MAFLPHDHDQLKDQIVADVLSRDADRPRIVGAVGLPAISQDLVTGLVRSALDYAAKTYGDAGADYILQYKDEIRQIIGPAVLEAADRLVHGLQDLKFGPH